METKAENGACPAALHPGTRAASRVVAAACLRPPGDLAEMGRSVNGEQINHEFMGK